MSTSLAALYALWDELGDVPVDDSGRIQARFGCFDAGAPRDEVWRWFEAENPQFVVGEVMQGRRVPDRLFIGVFPAGISYADRERIRAGDYARLAFLSYATLVLDVEPDCPEYLRKEIEGHAATLQARRGEHYEVSAAGQMVLLGGSATVARAAGAQIEAAHPWGYRSTGLEP
jgi:hypothetical protein